MALRLCLIEEGWLSIILYYVVRHTDHLGSEYRCAPELHIVSPDRGLHSVRRLHCDEEPNFPFLRISEWQLLSVLSENDPVSVKSH